MSLDDGRLTQLLEQERDRVLQQCELPGASQALFRARIGATRRRAARVSALVDRLMLTAAGLLALIGVAGTWLYVPLSDRGVLVFAGALGLGGGGMLVALFAMRATTLAASADPRQPRPAATISAK